MDKDLITILGISIIIIGMFFSAVRGIIKKKFRPIVLAVIFGLRSRGGANIFKKLEGSEAVNAAIAQIFLASLISMAIAAWFFNEKLSLISYDMLKYIIPTLVIIIGTISVVYIVKVSRKYRNLKEK